MDSEGVAGHTRGTAVEPVAGANLRWFVLHTKSRQEKALAADLLALRIRFVLPLIPVARYYGRRKVRVHQPLFPGYLFLHGSIENTYAADRTQRVAGIIKVADQDRLRAELANIEAALAAGAPLTPADAITGGTRVEVTSGPFKGIRGLAETGPSKDRLYLQVDLIGKGSILEIDRTLLRPVE